MSIANILHAIKFKFAVQAKNGLDYLLFVSPGRSMYGWKVTATCSCIDGVWPIEALIDSRTLKKRCALVARTEIQQTQEL